MNKIYLYFICLIAIMGGLMFGFDIAIIAGAVPFIQEYFNWNELELGWGVSSLLVGAIVGSLVSGMLTDRFGRKGILIVVALFFAVSSLVSALATSSTVFIVARLVGGLSVGAASVLSPLYVAEIVPSKIRGTLVSIYQLAITFGILVSYLINYALHDWDESWRWMMASGVIPSVVFFVGLFFIPESPRWLFLKGKKKRAFDILARISSKEEAEKEIDEINENLKKEDNKTGFRDLLSKHYRKPIVLGFLLAIFIQITGINTVIDYAPKILLAAGVEIEHALLQTSLIGIINFAFTFIAIWLIDKVGRKALYLFGSAAMAISLLLLSATFYFEFHSIFALMCLLLFIASFASCIGPVFWTLISEIFPNKIRGKGIAFASFTQWIFNFLIILVFPYVLETLGGSLTFIFLAFMCILQFLLTWMWLPETKGKSLEEIENLWEGAEAKAQGTERVAERAKANL